jgi:dTMP kinase
MLTDRYIYSLIARAIVRGADPDWIKQVYSFSLKPDATFYLRIEVNELVPRVLQLGGFDYWESGMDLPMGEDFYDSFIHYQGRVIAQLDQLAREYGFDTIDATRDVDEIAAYLAERVSATIEAGEAARDAVPAPR